MTPQTIRTVKALSLILLVVGALFWTDWIYSAGFGSYRSIEPYAVIIVLMGGSLAAKVAGNRAEGKPWWLDVTPGWATFFVLLSTGYNFLVAIVGLPVVISGAALVAGFAALALASVTAELMKKDPSPEEPAGTPDEAEETPTAPSEDPDERIEVSEDLDVDPEEADEEPSDSDGPSDGVSDPYGYLLS